MVSKRTDNARKADESSKKGRRKSSAASGATTDTASLRSCVSNGPTGVPSSSRHVAATSTLSRRTLPS
jgi:hypothetical protein